MRSPPPARVQGSDSLFGVLSIIRLRSSELDQPEIAYYCGPGARTPRWSGRVSDWLTLALMAALLVGLYLGDHPRLFAGYRTQTMNSTRHSPTRPTS